MKLIKSQSIENEFSVHSKLFQRSIFVLCFLLLSSISIFAQGPIIKGVVADAKTGETLIGANITIAGTAKGTVTDVNGHFSLNVPTNRELTISCIGYISKIIKSSTDFMNINLEPNVQSLNEIVVVGYGTQKKSDITGAVTSVSADRLSKIPVTNAMNALEGAVSGVVVTQTSSIPGSSPSVIIGGQNSINASSSPLVIVDGIPFQGNVNYINPNDIASIEILKDASAVAIYGTRGSNGVILISTKKGTSGKPSISYSVYGGIEDIAHILTPRTGAEYVTKYADYMSQTGQTQNSPVPNLYEVANYNAGKTVDWINLATQTGIIQDHNLSISGGAENIKYYISGNYTNEKGVVKGYNYVRSGIRSNIEAKVTDFLNTGLNLFLVSNNYNGGRVNLLFASAMSPYGQAINASTGKYNLYPMYPELLYTNPLINLYNSNTDERYDVNGSFFAELTFPFLPVLKGLKYHLNLSEDYNPTHSATYTSRDGGSTVGGSASVIDANTTLWVIENILTYNRDFNKHHVDFTGLYSSQANSYFSSTANATGFINDILTYNNLGGGATPSVGSYASQYSMESQMGRLNYSYDNRYLLTITARRDGYSAFGANTDKFGTFPSVAFGWNLANEEFMNSTRNFLDIFKLRLSYGKTGNMAIGVNTTETTDGTNKYPFNGLTQTGVLASVLGNANLHWESTTGGNIGVDFSFFNGRINGSIDAYDKQTTDLLMRRNVPQITGYSSVWDNLGKLNNTGINVSLNTVNISTNDFKWSSSINFSTNQNKILDLYGDKKSDLGNRWFIGSPIGVIYDYKMIGVWQTSEAADAAKFNAKPGYLKFADINNDGKIDANDKVILGQTTPKWYGGFTNMFEYKNFHLSIFIQTSQGSLKNNPDLNYADEQGRRNTPVAVGYWTAANMSNTRPSLAYNNTYGYGYPSDNSFTRIKDVTLSYTFAPTMLRSTFLKNLTLYFSGRNLYTFTKWIGWDPEDNYSTRGSGDWTNNYPNVRSMVFGMNVTLK